MRLLVVLLLLLLVCGNAWAEDDCSKPYANNFKWVTQESYQICRTANALERIEAILKEKK